MGVMVGGEEVDAPVNDCLCLWIRGRRFFIGQDLTNLVNDCRDTIGKNHCT